MEGGREQRSKGGRKERRKGEKKGKEVVKEREREKERGKEWKEEGRKGKKDGRKEGRKKGRLEEGRKRRKLREQSLGQMSSLIYAWHPSCSPIAGGFALTFHLPSEFGPSLCFTAKGLPPSSGSMKWHRLRASYSCVDLLKPEN